MTRDNDGPDDDLFADDSPHVSPEELQQATQPLEPWLAELTRDALPDAVVPRDAMWAAIQRQRAAERSGVSNVLPFVATTASVPKRTHSRFRAQFVVAAGIAATLVAGIAIGRYALPRALPLSAGVSDTPSVAAGVASADSVNAQSDPLRVATAEYLTRTEALLTTVRYEDPESSPAPDVAAWARDLLGTTRLLLDDPAMRDRRTRRLLEDLELVLVQVGQARNGSAVEARRAPSETLRETNLLPRVRAANSAASTLTSNNTSRGAAE